MAILLKLEQTAHKSKTNQNNTTFKPPLNKFCLTV